MKKLTIPLILILQFITSIYATTHISVCDSPSKESSEKGSYWACKKFCKGSKFYSFNETDKNCQCCDHGFGLASTVVTN